MPAEMPKNGFGKSPSFYQKRNESWLQTKKIAMDTTFFDSCSRWMSQLIKDFSQVDYGSRASLLGQRTADINRYTKSFDVKQVEI